MASSLMPFLYRTPTLSRLWRHSRALRQANSSRLLHTSRPFAVDRSVPFEWEQDPEAAERNRMPESSITPAEAKIFRGIFEEIARGKMPKERTQASSIENNLATRTNDASSTPQTSKVQPQSLVEQVRLAEFRDKFLERYPQVLQRAAHQALDRYTLEADESYARRKKLPKLEEADRSRAAQKKRDDQLREKQRRALDKMMGACKDDVALWEVMQDHVFTIPGQIEGKDVEQVEGIDGGHSPTAETQHEKRSMNVLGPLYPQHLIACFDRFEKAFAHPSPYALQILPEVKRRGLSSFVLGVSTPLYARIARTYWNRFGDAVSAMDTLQEMYTSGLYADEEARELLSQMREHLDGCEAGAQGPFVKAVVESAYDSQVMQRLGDMEQYVEQSIRERRDDAF